MPLWDDLYLYAGTSQSIYYATTGTAPNRQLVFEFLTGSFGYAATNTHHFQVVFYENALGIVDFKYFQSWDRGISATIGVQGKVFCR